jgi:EAL domain-containing protein (putative c-di-GMP-specific phosphodiesterase class I)
VAFAVDDFGSGFATLSRMAELPLTQIKVDRAILHHPLAEDELRLVVKTARYHRDRGDTHAARVVIVEGVDDASPLTLKQIFDQGIKHVQGYIVRQPAAPTIRRLPPEIREDIAARVRGGHDHRPSVVTRSEQPLRRTA